MIGYDKHLLNHQLLFDLTLEEATGGNGDYVYDRAKPHHRSELHGATIGWTLMPSGLMVIDCTPASPDWIDCPAAATGDLDFIAGDFSMAMWANVDDLTANRMLLCRGLLDTDGWHCSLLMNGSIVFYTSQVAAHQSSLSAAGEVVVGSSYLIGFTREGGSIRIYKNGVDVTDTVGAHLNPVTANRELQIGIYNGVGSPWDGQFWRPRIWGGKLEPWGMLELFNLERHWFGV